MPCRRACLPTCRYTFVSRFLNISNFSVDMGSKIGNEATRQKGNEIAKLTTDHSQLTALLAARSFKTYLVSDDLLYITPKPTLVTTHNPPTSHHSIANPACSATCDPKKGPIV